MHPTDVMHLASDHPRTVGGNDPAQLRHRNRRPMVRQQAIDPQPPAPDLVPIVSQPWIKRAAADEHLDNVNSDLDRHDGPAISDPLAVAAVGSPMQVETMDGGHGYRS